jgi:hypothetical protein
MRTRAIIGALTLTAQVALADDIPFDPAPLASCVDAGRGEACIGLGAGACIERDGPMSAGLCMAAENLWWLERGARAVMILEAREPEIQARARRLGWPDPVPGMASIAESFDAYRAAACGWRAAAWDGIHAAVEEMDCLMRLNARHALWLDERVRED